MANRPQAEMTYHRDDQQHPAQYPPHSQFPPSMPEVESPRLSPQDPDVKVPTARWDQLPDPAYVPYAEHYDHRNNPQRGGQPYIPYSEPDFGRLRRDSGADVIDEVRIHRKVYSNHPAKAKSASSSASSHRHGQLEGHRGLPMPPLADQRMLRQPMVERGRPHEVVRYRKNPYAASNSPQRGRDRGRSHGARARHDQVDRPRRKSGYLQHVKDRVHEKGGVEGIITPLRLGMLLGAFDIIGGSLCIWMAHKKFGKGSKKSNPDVVIIDNTRRTGPPRRRSPRGRRRDDPAHQSAYESDTDSEDEERQRRAAAYVREQARLNEDHDRHLSAAETVGGR